MVPSFLVGRLSGAEPFGWELPGLLAAALVTPEEMNSVRVYKQMAKSTVLIASAYVSAHHIAQASGKGLGSGVLIDEQGSIVTNAHVVDRGGQHHGDVA